MRQFNPGFDISWDNENMKLIYGREMFGPPMEQRKLEDIRNSLRDPRADGPDIPYAIAMDIGMKNDMEDLKSRQLLYGAVIYSKGKIGEEPVRSQGHIHAVSTSCGSSTPEVYEIWDGRAIVYMQEYAENQPGRCFAVYGKPGDVIIVPPGWTHCTVNADIHSNMVFGAWCIRDFGFDYHGVREHGGVAFFPVIRDEKLVWEKNERYDSAYLVEKEAREYPELGLKKGVPIYGQYQENPELFTFVTNPQSVAEIWKDFEP